MSVQTIEDKAFENIDYRASFLKKANYENCTFSNCNFANSKLNNIHFLDCNFHKCILRKTMLSQTGFQNVDFIDCELTELKFYHCNNFAFEIHLNNCNASNSSFYQMNQLEETRFTNCNLKFVDFSNANLRKAKFDNCNFENAIFDKTDLTNADFANSYNFIISPTLNTIKGAKFSKENISGLLNEFQIKIE